MFQATKRVYQDTLCGSIFVRVLFRDFFAIFEKYNPRKISQKFTSGKFDFRKMSAKKYLKNENGWQKVDNGINDISRFSLAKNLPNSMFLCFVTAKQSA